METQQVVVDREQALALWREYQKHQHWSEPVDREIMKAYEAIAKGRAVIRALEAVKVAGVDDEGLPKLALCRADAHHCTVQMSSVGGCVMSADKVRPRPDYTTNAFDWRRSQNCMVWPRDTFPTPQNRRGWRAEAIVPPCPLHLRPKRGLANYAILWEAEWTRRMPDDPMLLRRIGKGDLWLVVAAWLLTPVEKAALAARL
jgi:hypothetical protein